MVNLHIDVRANNTIIRDQFLLVCLFICGFHFSGALMFKRFSLIRDIGNLESDPREICEEAMW
jgi:hypothetical protein